MRPGLPFFQSENEIPRGNPNVSPEEAKTWTLGVVFTAPGSLENLTASLDFYNIEITDVIATIDSTFVYSKCFNADGSEQPDVLAERSGRLLRHDRTPGADRRARHGAGAVRELGHAR